MTEETANISINIKVENVAIEIKEMVALTTIEESVYSLVLFVGQQILHNAIGVFDARLAKNIPAGWRNVGTEKRWIISSLGTIQYKRRVYMNEQRKRLKPIDDLLGVQRYSRMSSRVQEMGAAITSSATYRLAANQLSYLTRTPISHSAIQRMVWTVGNRIADSEEAECRRIFEHGGQDEPGKISAPVLYGESLGVWGTSTAREEEIDRGIGSHLEYRS